MSNPHTGKPDSCSPERTDALFGHRDLLKEFDAISAFWEQQTLGQVNGQLLKIAKGLGKTNWHQHDDQDEAFLVIRGELIVETEEGSETLRSQHLHVVPRGVRHRTIAKRKPGSSLSALT